MQETKPSPEILEHQSKLNPSENKFHKGNGDDGKHYWLTPPDLMNELQARFNFDHDACPFPKPDDYDGLTSEWGQSTYVNPPFGSIIHEGKKKGPTAWMRKAIEENKKGKSVVVVYPIDKWVLMMLQAGAIVSNLGDVRWCATEDGSQGKGTGRHIAMFELPAHNISHAEKLAAKDEQLREMKTVAFGLEIDLTKEREGYAALSQELLSTKEQLSSCSGLYDNMKKVKDIHISTLADEVNGLKKQLEQCEALILGMEEGAKDWQSLVSELQTEVNGMEKQLSERKGIIRRKCTDELPESCEEVFGYDDKGNRYVVFYTHGDEIDVEWVDEDIPDYMYKDEETGVITLNEGWYEEVEQFRGEYDFHIVKRDIVEWIDESSLMPDARQEAIAVLEWLAKEEKFSNLDGQWWDKPFDNGKEFTSEQVYSEYLKEKEA